jgi:hypothetical protein
VVIDQHQRVGVPEERQAPLLPDAVEKNPVGFPELPLVIPFRVVALSVTRADHLVPADLQLVGLQHFRRDLADVQITEMARVAVQGRQPQQISKKGQSPQRCCAVLVRRLIPRFCGPACGKALGNPPKCLLQKEIGATKQNTAHRCRCAVFRTAFTAIVRAARQPEPFIKACSFRTDP